jgi:hypothetical protein
MLTSWSVLIVIGIYTGLRLFGIIPTAMYLLLVLLAIDGIFADIYMFKMAGDVDAKSSELLGNWKILLVNRKYDLKLRRMQLKSCPPLRMQIGSSNYFDVCTPLVILDLCLNQIVTLLIAS